MNTDVEDLLRDGMERFTAEVQAPAGLARTAGAARHTAAAGGPRRGGLRGRGRDRGGVIAVVAAAGGPAQTGSGAVQARTAAYVTRRVENALAGENLVFSGRTKQQELGNEHVTWAYRSRNRFEEFAGS